MQTPSDNAAPATVVLVHGMFETSRSMACLAGALRGAGYAVHLFDYDSRGNDFKALAERFRGWVRERAAGAVLHCVGHSMGGLVVRAGLAAPPPELRLGRVVLIAVPNHGVRLLQDWSAVRAAFKRLFGAVHQAHKLLDPEIAPPAEIGVIAGTRRLHPLDAITYVMAVLHPFRPHDGVVEVEAAKLPAMRDFVTVPASHDTICKHPEAVRQTLHFLERGRFAPPSSAKSR